MPAMLLTPPALDPDVLGPLLVAEVEQYLRTVAPAGKAIATVSRAAPVPDVRYGQHVMPWHHPHPAVTATLTDRLLGRRPTADVTVQQYLLLVDRYIHRHGWTQGLLWAPDGAVCVLGAQLAVLAAGYGTAATAWRARIRIGNQLGYAGHPVPVDQWNDHPGRRQHEVHRLLQTAAARP